MSGVQRRGPQRAASHPLQSAGPEDRLILLGVQLSPKQDVTANGSRKHPGLLGSVGQPTFDLQDACVVRQLSQDGA